MAIKIASTEWLIHLCEQLEIEPSNVRRIIIDAKVNSAVIIYVEQYGTDKLFDLRPPDVSAAEIRIAGED